MAHSRKGPFSKITGLSIKAIHLYHEKGLLVPNAVDRESGYRYFDQHNVEKGHRRGRGRFAFD